MAGKPVQEIMDAAVPGQDGVIDDAGIEDLKPAGRPDSQFANHPVAIDHYKRHGCDTVEDAFMIANILHTARCVLEASYFYGVAVDLHSQAHDQYPQVQTLLQVKLLCQLKAGQPADPSDLDRLRSLNAPYAAYIEGVMRAWQAGDLSGAMNIIGNAFEEFHTGEEADTLFLDIARQSSEGIFKERPQNSMGIYTIPKRLYMYWDRNPPPEIQENFRYHRALPGVTLKVFDHEEAKQWLYDVYGVEARSIFLRARHPAEAADIFRVHVINTLGGWWMDADIRLKNVDMFNVLASSSSNQTFFLTDNFYIHNDFFGSSAGTSVIGDCLLSLYRNCYLHPSLFIAYKTGPGIFNRALNRAVYNHRRGIRSIAPTSLFDHHKFAEYVEEFDTPYKSHLPNWQTA